MTHPSIKSAPGGAAIAAVALLMPVAGAQAQVQCRSDGWSWNCMDYGPAPAWGYYHPGFNNNFYGDYNDIPNDYPGPSPVYNNR